MTQEEIERKAASIPAEERPVALSKLSGLGDFLGIYGGEHIAATEFVIGALLVTWGVRAKELLLHSTLTVSQVGESVGYVSSSHFAHIFRKFEGCSPSEYQRCGQAGAEERADG